jgi:hypothetical protein
MRKMPVALLLGMVAMTVVTLSACGSPAAPPAGATTESPQTQTFTPEPSVSSQPTATAEQATVTVVDAGFTRQNGDTPMIAYGVVLENTSKVADALDLSVTVNFLDPSGTVMQTEGTTIGVIPAGWRYYLGGTSSPARSDKTTKIETTVVVGSSVAAQYQMPKATNVRLSDDGFGNVTVRGVITNPYSVPMSSDAAISVVCFNARGKVIGGGQASLNNDVPIGSRAGFEAYMFAIKSAAVKSLKVTMGNPNLQE